MRVYVVQQGDHLGKIALVFGVEPDAIWHHADNAGLTSKRKPNVLFPGDVIHIPEAQGTWLPIEAGTTNSYTARVPTMDIHVRFRDDSGALANEAWEIRGGGHPPRGTTDSEGMLRTKVPVNTREVVVRFPQRRVTHILRVGDMDPVEEPEGVRKRLQNLGFYREARRGSLELDLNDEEKEQCDREGIEAFQRAHGLEPTGILDEDTRAELLGRHGS